MLWLWHVHCAGLYAGSNYCQSHVLMDTLTVKLVYKLWNCAWWPEMGYKHTFDTIYTHFQGITNNIYSFGRPFFAPLFFLPVHNPSSLFLPVHIRFYPSKWRVDGSLDKTMALRENQVDVTWLLTDCECNIHKHCVDQVHELCNSKKKINKRQSMLDRIMIRKPPINNPSKSFTLTYRPSVKFVEVVVWCSLSSTSQLIQQHLVTICLTHGSCI